MEISRSRSEGKKEASYSYRLHSFRSDDMGRVQDGFTIIPVYCMCEFKN